MVDTKQFQETYLVLGETKSKVMRENGASLSIMHNETKGVFRKILILVIERKCGHVLLAWKEKKAKI